MNLGIKYLLNNVVGTIFIAIISYISYSVILWKCYNRSTPTLLINILISLSSIYSIILSKKPGLLELEKSAITI